MRGLVAQREAPVAVADRVGERAAARYDEQPVAPTELADRPAQVEQRVVAGLAGEPAADLHDRQHRARPLGGQLGQRRRGRRGALLRAPGQIAHSQSEPRGDVARQERARAERHDGRERAELLADVAGRLLHAPHLLAVQVRGDPVDLIGAELVDVGADQARHPLARVVDGGGPAVGGGARVAVGADVAEDQVDVGADREQLGGDRAPSAAHRHLRGDRGEVRPQDAGVDELAGQQAVEVGPAPDDHVAAGDRDEVDRGAPDVDHQRVRPVRGDDERARHPVGRRHLQRALARDVRGQELAHRVQYPEPGAGQRRRSRVEHELHALPLGAERVGELGGHRQRDRLHARPARPRRPPRAAPRRARRGRARPRTGAKGRAAGRRPARRPSCSPRRRRGRSRRPCATLRGHASDPSHRPQGRRRRACGARRASTLSAAEQPPRRGRRPGDGDARGARPAGPARALRRGSRRDRGRRRPPRDAGGAGPRGRVDGRRRSERAGGGRAAARRSAPRA